MTQQFEDLHDLRGRAVIVTGASSGIGAATARALHGAGAHPVLAARRAERLESLSAELGDALSVPADVTDADQMADLVGKTLERFGRIDGLVNNAGQALHDQPIETLDLGEFQRIVDLNVTSVIRLMQLVLPAMRSRGFGRIVNISSGTTRTAVPGTGGYASTKSSVNMLSAVARKELEGSGVTVGVILPSITVTEFGEGRFQNGRNVRPGMIAHSPDYVAAFVLRALCTGEERIDIPHGPEQPDLTRVPKA
jgi:NADP-dependent 3-hydroxy acid dehydrogenase YdfG